MCTGISASLHCNSSMKSKQDQILAYCHLPTHILDFREKHIIQEKRALCQIAASARALGRARSRAGESDSSRLAFSSVV